MRASRGACIHPARCNSPLCSWQLMRMLLLLLLPHVSVPCFLCCYSRVLWVSENKIRELPKELAKCSHISELRVGINPMVPKWKKLIASGTPKLMWTCRQLAMEAERGDPPVMECVRNMIVCASKDGCFVTHCGACT